jgi:2-C-methyl-D-erythritol 4-phosphate cytidylyltransferase
MEKARKEKFTGTDESMLMRRAKYHVEIVEGSMLNFKVTTKEDLDLLRSLTNSH